MMQNPYGCCIYVEDLKVIHVEYLKVINELASLLSHVGKNYCNSSSFTYLDRCSRSVVSTFHCKDDVLYQVTQDIVLCMYVSGCSVRNGNAVTK